MKKALISLLIIVMGVIFINSLLGLEGNKNYAKDSGQIIKNYKPKEEKVVTDELLVLVNYKNKIPDNWQVDLVDLENNQSIDQRAYQGLMEMLNDAKKEGLNIIICSSYRSYDKQKELFINKVEKYLKKGYSLNEAQRAASEWVAKPNTSEHQLGLAVDLVSKKNQHLDSSQEKTKEQAWLMENCYRYGFILRYPLDKSEVTKIGYEPWHYRYVGKKHAKEIMMQKICLEEYIDNLLND